MPSEAVGPVIEASEFTRLEPFTRLRGDAESSCSYCEHKSHGIVCSMLSDAILIDSDAVYEIYYISSWLFRNRISIWQTQLHKYKTSSEKNVARRTSLSCDWQVSNKQRCNHSMLPSRCSFLQQLKLPSWGPMLIIAIHTVDVVHLKQEIVFIWVAFFLKHLG